MFCSCCAGGSSLTWKKATKSGHEISPNMKLSANP